MPDTRLSIGIDFGTTNTVVAVADDAGDVAALNFDHGGERVRIFNSALCFWQEETATRVEGGPWAIAKYLEDSAPHRFIQSFKSFAASRSFTDTRIFRQRFAFEDLLTTFLRNLAKHAGTAFDLTAGPVVIGRPVKFAGSAPDEALALQRYQAAFASMGLSQARFVYEPVGAAYYYARQLREDAVILVADFGGGTSDFSVMRFRVKDGRFAAEPLGHAGIGIAGDAFDYRIIDHLVSPRLGKGSEYESFGKRITIPNRYYGNFARWSHLPLMKTNGELRELQELQRQAVEPEKLADFISVIDNDQGFELYRAVSSAKLALSTGESVDFRFHDVRARITRRDFESWIAPDVALIEQTIETALRNAGLSISGIDKVFLTGGSSFIPAVRALFMERFGEARIVTGQQFESIAYGLAMMGDDAAR